jgi:citrate lyase gamma subunit
MTEQNPKLDGWHHIRIPVDEQQNLIKIPFRLRKQMNNQIRAVIRRTLQLDISGK